jgi:lysophospholipase L1-like esterase
VARAIRYLGQLAVLLIVTLVLAELTLRAASLLATDRATTPAPDAAHVVLCVGDSHTFGAGLPASEAYPAYLQAFLDAAAPGQYAVVNLGIPGMSTTQVLHRLPDLVRSYHPDAVVMWSGVNDSWNTSELDAPATGLTGRLRAALRSTRLHRLWRVWRHNEQLFKDAQWDQAGPVPRPRVASDSGTNPNRTVTVDWGGDVEQLRFTGVERSSDDPAIEQRAQRNYESAAELVRAANASLILVTYPHAYPDFMSANRAMRAAAARQRLRLVDSKRALERVPRAQRQWVLTLHPTGPIYREVARDVARSLLKSARRPNDHSA